MRFASLLLASLWIGGLVALGVVAAPEVFAVLEGRDPAGGRTVAGVVFGAVLHRAQFWLWIVGGLQFLLLAARAVIGPRPRGFKWQLGILAGMLALTGYTDLVVAPRIAAIRDQTPVAMAALPSTDPVRMEFGRLHGLSNGLLALALAGAVTMLWLDRRE